MSELIKMTVVSSSGERESVGAFAGGMEEIRAWIETKDMDFGAPWKAKHIQAIVLDVEPVEFLGDAKLYVGYKERREQSAPIAWTGPYPLVGGDKVIYPDRYTDRFVRLRIEDANPKGTWKLSNMRFYGVVEGIRL